MGCISPVHSVSLEPVGRYLCIFIKSVTHGLCSAKPVWLSFESCGVTEVRGHLIVQTEKSCCPDTGTHSRPIALPGPLQWLVIIMLETASNCRH